MTLLAQSGVCRRTVIGAGAALFAAPHVMANEVIDSRAATLVDAVNLEDRSALLIWAAETISADGLRRRSAEAFASLLAASRVGTGRWHLLSTETDARRVRATIRLAGDAGVRRIDLLIDRSAHDRLFDVRAALDPLPYPGELRPAADIAALKRALTRRIAFAVANDQFSGAILVVDPTGRVCFAAANGFADIARNQRNTAATRFNLGSIDKSLTATMIGQMVEQGLLRFERKVGELLPGLANSTLGQPTIEQLLAHSGGLGEPKGGILAYSQQPYTRVAELLPALCGVPPAFAPGSRTAYSNEGYVVLGAVIEAVTGQPWWSALEERIYRPVGMRDSAHLTRVELPSRRAAIGYYRAADDLLQQMPLTANHATAPWRGNSCGGGYTTVGDAITWLRGFRSAKLVSVAMRDRLVAQTGYPHPDLAYGLGFARRTVNGSLWVGHSGGGVMVGIGSALAVDMKSGWAVAVLTNRDVSMAEALLADTLRLIPQS